MYAQYHLRKLKKISEYAYPHDLNWSSKYPIPKGQTHLRETWTNYIKVTSRLKNDQFCPRSILYLTNNETSWLSSIVRTLNHWLNLTWMPLGQSVVLGAAVNAADSTQFTTCPVCRGRGKTVKMKQTYNRWWWTCMLRSDVITQLDIWETHCAAVRTRERLILPLWPCRLMSVKYFWIIQQPKSILHIHSFVLEIYIAPLKSSTQRHSQSNRGEIDQF